MSPSSYEHTQRGPIGFILLGCVVICVIAALAPSTQAPGRWISGGIAFLCSFLALCLHSLTVRMEEDRLRISFGPIPLLGRTISLDEISGAECARSTLIDGFGIHWGPGRGWIWNLWGFDCVRLTLEDGRKLRVGTDDGERLVAALSERISRRPANPASRPSA